jgi:hypothetical protein
VAEEAVVLPNVLLTITGPDGREWMAGAYMGSLNCITPGPSEEIEVAAMWGKDYKVTKIVVVDHG